MKHILTVWIMLFLALVPALSLAGKGHDHSAPPPVVQTNDVPDSGKSRDSLITLGAVGLIGAGIACVVCRSLDGCGESRWCAADTPVALADNEPTRVTPNNLSGGSILETTISGGVP